MKKKLSQAINRKYIRTITHIRDSAMNFNYNNFRKTLVERKIFVTGIEARNLMYVVHVR